jgi:hypothetical protein
MGRNPRFDPQAVELWPLERRGHELTTDQVLPLAAPASTVPNPEIAAVATAILQARQEGRPVIVMMGAHAIKLGLSRFLVDFIERRWITHLATNGAGIIHDYELALVGGTSEDVARWIRVGQFGLWEETSRLNDLVVTGAARGEGLGECVGRTIEEEQFPYRSLSIAAAGWRCRVPVTSHVTVGADIVHAHPNCDGAAWGQATYEDFLVFAEAILHLEGGVFLNVGSAVTGPEVYLKALAMARNVARQAGGSIRRFTTAVFDVLPLPVNAPDGEPPKDDPRYCYRPWKTILVRTVADGGRSYYCCGDHRQTIPTLWHELVSRSGSRGMKTLG